MNQPMYGFPQQTQSPPSSSVETAVFYGIAALFVVGIVFLILFLLKVGPFKVNASAGQAPAPAPAQAQAPASSGISFGMNVGLSAGAGAGAGPGAGPSAGPSASPSTSNYEMFEYYTASELASFASNVSLSVKISVANPGDLNSVSVTRTRTDIADVASAQTYVGTDLTFTFKPMGSGPTLENFVGTHSFKIQYTTFADTSKFVDYTDPNFKSLATISENMISLFANGTGTIVNVPLSVSQSGTISTSVKRTYVLITNNNVNIFPPDIAVYLSPDSVSGGVFMYSGAASVNATATTAATQSDGSTAFHPVVSSLVDGTTVLTSELMKKETGTAAVSFKLAKYGTTTNQYLFQSTATPANYLTFDSINKKLSQSPTSTGSFKNKIMVITYT